MRYFISAPKLILLWNSTEYLFMNYLITQITSLANKEVSHKVYSFPPSTHPFTSPKYHIHPRPPRPPPLLAFPQITIPSYPGLSLIPLPLLTFSQTTIPSYPGLSLLPLPLLAFPQITIPSYPGLSPNTPSSHLQLF